MAASAAKPPLPAVERFFQFSLLGMLASGYFAVAGSSELDWPSQALTLIGLAIYAARIMGWTDFVLPHRAASALVIAEIGFYPLDYEYLSRSFPLASLHLVFFLLTIKLFSAESDRDYAYLRMLAALELLAAAMLSMGPSFFAFLALFLLFTIASLAGGEIRRSAGLRPVSRQPGPRRLGRRLGLLSMVLFTGILVLTAGMFFVLPRTARAALGRFAPRPYHLPGFSNQITLGEIGEIKRSSRSVMHVRSDGASDLTQVRWRGAALTRFDGNRWFSPPGPDETLRVERGVVTLPAVPRRPGHGLSYVVRLDEIAADTLFFAGTPETILINLPGIRISRGGAFHVPRLPDGIVYSAYSLLEDEAAPAPGGPVGGAPVALLGSAREEALGLPATDPRIPELARAMTEGARTDTEKARALERHLRRDYGYTLDLLKAPVADPLAHFLFVRRKGHCEYFASAMAVMLRTLDIPSRVVTGFQSGVFNPITGMQVVRASDAHSWVEAWIPGSGWTTFDPTPADPQAASGLANRIAMYLDAADRFWQDWVVSYDLERQVLLASRMQESSRKLRFPWISGIPEWWKDVTILGSAGALLAGAGILMLILFYSPRLAAWWRRRRGVRRAQRGEGQASDATLLYQRMLALMARRGFQKPPWLTPAEFARVLPVSETSVLVEDLTSAYNAFRFGGRQDEASRIIRLLDQLEGIGR